MTTTTLIFQDTNFDVVDREGQVWLQSSQIAQALGYADEGAISRIYRRNADEFTESMSETVKMTVSGNMEKTVRIFTLRGTHLLAMFSRTETAKKFRKWVLDVLDRITTLPFNPHKDIQDEVWRVSGGKQSLKADLYRMLKDRFAVERFTDIPAHQCLAAVEYVRSLKPEVTAKPVLVNTDPDKLTRAFALASEVGSVASRTVFEAVMTGDESWLNRRWLFCLSQNTQGQPLPYASTLGREDFITSFEQLPGMILDSNGLLASNRDLLALASACNHKLTQRLGTGPSLPPPRT